MPIRGIHPTLVFGISFVYTRFTREAAWWEQSQFQESVEGGQGERLTEGKVRTLRTGGEYSVEGREKKRGGPKDRTKSDDSWSVESPSFSLSPPFPLDLGGVLPQAARSVAARRGAARRSLFRR